MGRVNAALQMQLRSVIAELDESLSLIREQLAREHPGVEPALLRDVSGRYVLLDGLAAKAEAVAALAHLHA
jgi:hypothetical protein